MTLTLAVMQVAVYLYVRNVAAASAAEGARYAANANAESGKGAERAEGLIGSSADDLDCRESTDVGTGGVTLMVVSCRGKVPLLFGLLSNALPLDVTARAVKEGS